MTNPAIDLTDILIFTVYQSVITGLVPTTVQVVRAQVNRVSPPAGTDYIVMTPTRRNLLELPVLTWDEVGTNPVTINMLAPTQVDIQLDVYGPNSANYATVINAMFESGQGYDLFRYNSNLPSGAIIEPLYCETPKQVPFITGADQYMDRWVVETAIQADVNLTINQDFANTLVAGLIDVDAVYPP